MTRSCLYMVCKDQQPFCFVENPGFRHVAQTFIDIGAKNGSIPVDDILCDRSTLSKCSLPKEYEACVDKLKLDLNNVAHVAITTDHWTDDLVKNSYQAFTIHFINDAYELQTTCLGVYEFTEAKTGFAIKAKTIEVLKMFLPEHFDTGNIVYITDNASNVKAAYRNDVRLSCAGHNLNLVVEKVFKSTAGQIVNDTIKCAKEVVGYFKHSGANSELEHTLKQDVSTRWNSRPV